MTESGFELAGWDLGPHTTLSQSKMKDRSEVQIRQKGFTETLGPFSHSAGTVIIEGNKAVKTWKIF